MTKTIELTLDKECDLQPGTDFHLVKVDGKKLTVEVTTKRYVIGNDGLLSLTDYTEPTGNGPAVIETADTILGMFETEADLLDSILEDTMKTREQQAMR